MAKSIIKFTRTRDVMLPQRGHEHDAGIDFFVPKFDKNFTGDLKKKNPELFPSQSKYEGAGYMGTISMNAGENSPVLTFDLKDHNDSILKYDEEEGRSYIPLAPMSRINIPSGIYVKMSESGRALIAANKSGVVSKHGLIFGAQVVDYEYQGEIHIHVINTSSKVVRIYEDQKLIQFLEMPIFTSVIEEVRGISELYPLGATSRADGGFGSTDKKNAQQLNS